MWREQYLLVTGLEVSLSDLHITELRVVGVLQRRLELSGPVDQVLVRHHRAQMHTRPLDLWLLRVRAVLKADQLATERKAGPTWPPHPFRWHFQLLGGC